MPRPQLVATFGLDAERLTRINAEFGAVTENPLVIEPHRTFLEHANACGDAQNVMHLIGAVAAQGEDALIRVDRVLNRPS